jgi:hypothetical protein
MHTRSSGKPHGILLKLEILANFEERNNKAPVIEVTTKPSFNKGFIQPESGKLFKSPAMEIHYMTFNKPDSLITLLFFIFGYYSVNLKVYLHFNHILKNVEHG